MRKALRKDPTRTRDGERGDAQDWMALGSVVLFALAMAACSWPWPTGPSTTTTVVQTVTQTQGGSSPAPNASASPGESGLCPLAKSVRVAPFGFDGCSQSNSAGVLPVGCTASVTATAKDAQAADVNLTDATPITWAIVSGGDHISLRPFTGETFNQLVTGNTPGSFDVSATVCGVTGHYAAVVK